MLAAFLGWDMYVPIREGLRYRKETLVRMRVDSEVAEVLWNHRNNVLGRWLEVFDE